MQKHKSDLVAQPQWQSLVDETDVAKQVELSRAIAGKLTVKDVDDLLGTLSNDDLREKYAALGLLLILVRENKEGWKTHKEKISSILQLLTSAYFLSGDPIGVGARAFTLLRLIEPKNGEKVLLTQIDVPNLSDERYKAYLRHLVSVKSEPTIAKLHELADQGGSKGKAARQQLADSGFIDPKTLSDLGAKWKKSRSVKYLNQLYNNYVSRQLGKPLDSLFDILGKPSRQDGKNYWYDTKEKFALFLQEDGQGNIKAFKMLD